MKSFVLCTYALGIIFLTGCSGDGIVDSKPGEPIDPVTNLEYAVSGDEVELTWNLPSSFPNDIVQPVSVHLRVKTDGITADVYELGNAPESYTYSSYDSSKEYRFTVKVMAEVDTSEPHISDLRYSLGETVIVQKEE